MRSGSSLAGGGSDPQRGELNEVELVVAEDSSKANGAFGADTLGAGFELVEVLSRDVEASDELGEGLLVRLTDSGKELCKGKRPWSVPVLVDGLESRQWLW